jgi:chemotaxis signal transduction protein
VTTYVQVRVAAEDYAIPVEHVLEIARLTSVTAVPGAPPALLGIHRLHGQILPVIDIVTLLGIPRQAPPVCLLVAQAGGRQAGLAIDEVSKVGPLADPVEETESDLLAGATLTEGQLVGIIDVARVFDAAGGGADE